MFERLEEGREGGEGRRAPVATPNDRRLCAQWSQLFGWSLFFVLLVAGSTVKEYYDVLAKAQEKPKAIHHPEERAGEAAAGVLTSFILGFVLIGSLFNLVPVEVAGRVEVAPVAIVEAAVRGGLVSTLVAMAAERLWTRVEGEGILRMAWGGFAEECAKLLAVVRLGCICGAPASSPRALCVCGIAAGACFMAVENMSYFEEVALFNKRSPQMQSSLQGLWGHPDQIEKYLRHLRIAVITRRLFLNPHPLLTGLAACRLGKAYETIHRLRSRCLTSFCSIILALLPSVLVHGFQDAAIYYCTGKYNPSFVGWILPCCTLLTMFLLWIEWRFATPPVSNGEGMSELAALAANEG